MMSTLGDDGIDLEFDETKSQISDDAIHNDQHKEHSSAMGYRERRLIVAV